MNPKQERLHGKVAVVTGTGSGIGQGCALMFARHGAKVVGCDINAASSEATVAAARKEGLEMSSVQPCDMTDAAAVRGLCDFAVKQYGGIDILLNAAATAVFAPIEQMTLEDFQKTLRHELDVIFLACKTAWPHMVARGGGSIINIASMSSHEADQGLPGLAHCAGKGGVLSMTRQLAMEGSKHKIRANTISPGLILTGATRGVLESNPDFKNRALARMMVKRIGMPEDVAWCATFLASDESAYITAVDILVDGGIRAN